MQLSMVSQDSVYFFLTKIKKFLIETNVLINNSKYTVKY